MIFYKGVAFRLSSIAFICSLTYGKVLSHGGVFLSILLTVSKSSIGGYFRSFTG
ncbi:hypothetical protein [Spirosoma foliorum]|uniref:Uncharacterized protein n=1 Tax=Spirosoma foliorum TaxID=2710596 RepID=A0A7G5H597_9BACT|nr:hypothetical protein [Spirosoma foliorum]QMW06289.1 hypothetical protein H3H32_16085 [Spirosoma foliorum]